MTDAEIKCVICGSIIGKEGASQYAAFGGLPSPCCVVCFEVFDYSITSLAQLAVRSIRRREEDHEFVRMLGIEIEETK